MSNNYFKFKKFTINQERCAMKVGTDGCLLGSWFDCSSSQRILDIGTGSGLIAIMAAQRCNALVTGIEIDNEAATQAVENVNNSPWKNRIRIVKADLQDYSTAELFDTIVSNPPYFINSLKCDSASRTLARHSDSLTSEVFFGKASDLITPEGKISIVIPCDLEHEWCNSAKSKGFTPSRITYIKTTPKKSPKRVLIEFTKDNTIKCTTSTIVLESEPGIYSKEAKDILRDFYLKIM